MENREAIKWIESRMRSGDSCDEVWQAGDIAIRAIEHHDLDCIVKHLTKECSYNETGCADCRSKLKIEAALLQATPLAPIHVNETHEQHLWQTNSKGEIDEWAHSNGYHNGPVCLRCGATPCVHCDPNYNDTPCIVDHFICPRCGKRIYFGDKFCEHCGQTIDVSKYKEEK